MAVGGLVNTNRCKHEVGLGSKYQQNINQIINV